MTIEHHLLQHMAVAVEAAGSFCTNKSVFGDFTDVPFTEGTAQLTLTQDMLPAGIAQQKIDGYAKDVLGKKSAQLTFQMIFASTGTAATNAVTQITSALGIILKATYGAENLSTGTTTNDSSISSPYDLVTLTASTGITAGTAMALPTGTGGAYEAGIVQGKSTHDVTTQVGFTGAASNGSTCLGAATYTPTEDPDTSLQFVVEGAEQSDRWRLEGGQLTSPPTYTTTIGGLPMISFTFTFADWSNLASDQAITAAAYTAHQPAAFVSGELIAVATGTATRAVVNCSQVSFAPAISYIPVPSPSGTNGVLRWRRNRTAPLCTLTFTLPFQDDSEWFAIRDAATDYHFALQIGRTAGAIVLIQCSTMQVTDVQRVNEGGMAYQTVTAKSRLDTDSDTTIPAGYAAHRVALM